MIDCTSSADPLPIPTDSSSRACKRGDEALQTPRLPLTGIEPCECLGPKVARPTVYVVWHTPTHPEKPWAVGCEIRPACLKVDGHVESKWLADLLAKRLGDGDYRCYRLIEASRLSPPSSRRHSTRGGAYRAKASRGRWRDLVALPISRDQVTAAFTS
jgi:hypothetical protein